MNLVEKTLYKWIIIIIIIIINSTRNLPDWHVAFLGEMQITEDKLFKFLINSGGSKAVFKLNGRSEIITFIITMNK